MIDNISSLQLRHYSPSSDSCPFFSPYEQVSNMVRFVSKLYVANECLTLALQIVAIPQWRGLLIVQDTRTPPLLDAIYEQITRGAAGYSDLVWCVICPTNTTNTK
jgi:hypothetical protein